MTKQAVVPKAKFLEVTTSAKGLSFNLGNGTKIALNVADLNETIMQQAALHGLNQKVRDAAAGFSKESDFAGAQDAMEAVIEALLGGTWNRQGGGESTGGILAEAIARIKNVALEKAQAAVANATEEQKKLWNSAPSVKAEIAKIRAERAAKAASAKNDDLDIDL